MSDKQKQPVAEEDDHPQQDKPYDREAKIKELLDQDKSQPYADDFMGF